ncbi:hypothetical protein PR048_033454 [Dryococelus australis]|uniref:Uncharacterized protein n=1 Tax=Dryococelus australis TaxID=614101 RepID=A0ABQ9G357_9NEOP|nr:hypothetical protein PR048_033454 [Dryococelus australis]
MFQIEDTAAERGKADQPPSHALDYSAPIADLQGNKKRIPYCQMWGSTGTTANEQTSEDRLYERLWSLAYRSLNSRNFPIPSCALLSYPRVYTCVLLKGLTMRTIRQMNEKNDMWEIMHLGGALLPLGTTKMLCGLQRVANVGDQTIRNRLRGAGAYRPIAIEDHCSLAPTSKCRVSTHWVSAVTVEGDDWANVLQEVSPTMLSRPVAKVSSYNESWRNILDVELQQEFRKVEITDTRGRRLFWQGEAGATSSERVACLCLPGSRRQWDGQPVGRVDDAQKKLVTFAARRGACPDSLTRTTFATRSGESDTPTPQNARRYRGENTGDLGGPLTARGGGNGTSPRIPTCGNPVTRLGIEPGSPWWEASVLTGRPPRANTGSIPSRTTPGFSHIAGRWVFSGISRFQSHFISALLHTTPGMEDGAERHGILCGDFVHPRRALTKARVYLPVLVACHQAIVSTNVLPNRLHTNTGTPETLLFPSAEVEEISAESLIVAPYRRQDCTPVKCFARRGDERVDAHVSVAPSAPTLLGLRTWETILPKKKLLRNPGHILRAHASRGTGLWKAKELPAGLLVLRPVDNITSCGVGNLSEGGTSRQVTLVKVQRPMKSRAVLVCFKALESILSSKDNASFARLQSSPWSVVRNHIRSRLESFWEVVENLNLTGSRICVLPTASRVLRADEGKTRRVRGSAGIQARGGNGHPSRKSPKPVVSSGTIPTCVNRGSDPAGNRTRHA